jgi:NAD(P)H-nitrite reductase large subunit
MTKTHRVIIGNSGAALGAIQAIREVDTSSSITLISAENGNAYSPVLLSYYLHGAISREDLFIVDSKFYVTMGVKTIFGKSAVAIDPSRNVVHLQNGMAVEYDNLLIATGASPITPNGMENVSDGVFSLKTIDDADRILDCARRAQRAAVIGGGLIGLQVSDALHRRGIKVAIIEAAGQLLPDSVDADCALLLQQSIESLGISVLLNQKAQAIIANRKGPVIITDSGLEIAADMAIVAAGLRPNIELAASSGIEANKGILVDERMSTNIGDIFAAGDVSEGNNLVTGQKEVIPTWINACRQGRIAGLNMAGIPHRYEGGLRETIATVFDFTVAAVGMHRISESSNIQEYKYLDPLMMNYRKILLRQDRLVGAVLLSKTADVGVLRNLIETGKSIPLCHENPARILFNSRGEFFRTSLAGQCIGVDGN